MSASLRDAAISPMERVDIPLTDYTPASEEDIKRFEEICEWLAKRPFPDPAEEDSKPVRKEKKRDEADLKRVEELFGWLAGEPPQGLAEMTRELICEDGKEEEKTQHQHCLLRRGWVILKDITESLESPEGADGILYEGRISRRLIDDTRAEISLTDRIVILNDECLPDSMGKNHVEIKGHKYYKVYFRFFDAYIYPNLRDNLQFMGSHDDAGRLTMEGLLTDIRFKEKVYLLYALKKRDFYKPILDRDESLKKFQTEIRNKLYQRIARSCQVR